MSPRVSISGPATRKSWANGPPASCWVSSSAGLCSAGSVGAGAERADAIPLVVIVHDRAMSSGDAGSGAAGSGPHLLADWRGIEWHSERPAAPSRAATPAFTVQLIIQAKLRPTPPHREVRDGSRACNQGTIAKGRSISSTTRSRILELATHPIRACHGNGHRARNRPRTYYRRKGHSPEGLMRAVLGRRLGARRHGPAAVFA